MLPIKHNKEPRPQGGALKPKFSKPKTEIPKQVRDDKTLDPNPVVMLNLFQHLIKVFSAFGRRTFHPRPQDGVFRCDLNKEPLGKGWEAHSTAYAMQHLGVLYSSP